MSPGIGGMTGPLPVATMTAFAATSVSSPTATRRSPSNRASPRTSSTPRSSSHGTLARVVEVVDHLVAPREHGRHVESVGTDAGNALRLGEQVTRPEQRLRGHARVVGALAADEVLLDERDREPALAEPPRGDLAGRAGADHDDVEAALGHAPSVADARCATIAA